jgi:hypothetical protein
MAHEERQWRKLRPAQTDDGRTYGHVVEYEDGERAVKTLDELPPEEPDPTDASTFTKARRARSKPEPESEPEPTPEHEPESESKAIRIVSEKWLARRTEIHEVNQSKIVYRQQPFERRAFRLPADLFLQWSIHQTLVEARFDPRDPDCPCSWHTPMCSLACRVKGHREFDREDSKAAWARIAEVITAHYGQPWKDWLEAQGFVLWSKGDELTPYIGEPATWKDLVEDFGHSWDKCKLPGPSLTRAEIMALVKKHPRPMPENFPGTEVRWEFCEFLFYLVQETGNRVQQLGQGGLAPLLGCSSRTAWLLIQWGMKVGVLDLDEGSKSYIPGKKARSYRVTDLVFEWTHSAGSSLERQR